MSSVLLGKSGKRFRQTNISECFSSFKKGRKNSVMEEEKGMNCELRELMASAAEKRIASCSSYTQSSEGNRFDESSNGSCSTQIITDYFVADSATSLSQSSEDLFPDEIQNECDSTAVSSSSKEKTIRNPEEAATYLNRVPDCCRPLPQLTPKPSHTILFRPYLRDGDAPRPYPDEYRDKWDSDHVRMPCSPESLFPGEDENGEKIIQSRWEIIKKSLTRNISSSHELQEAILQYNSQYSDRWDFRGLHAFFDQVLTKEERTSFFQTTIQSMVKLALNLPHICTQPIPLLKRQKDHSITLSQKQIGSLLANAFFCTFPRRNTLNKRNGQKWNSEYASYPDINFNRLFIGAKDSIMRRRAEKLKCLLNYFRRITTKEPTGTVTFHRQYLQNLPNWATSTSKLAKMVVQSDGLIEVEGNGMLQVDFANKFVGGGVLGLGCVQEEIRFIICPELIVSRLFTECLNITEVLVISGVEQYNKYKGYGDTFLWDGDYQDLTPRDAWGRKCTHLVAMDALHFRNGEEQFKIPFIERELNKAFCGFFEYNAVLEELPAVATGNWGCGAFKGDPRLKILIQLMAASEVGRDMIYFTFGNKKLQEDIEDMYMFLNQKQIKVGDLWMLIEQYCSKCMEVKKQLRPTLYEYFYCLYADSDTETECSQQSTNSITPEHILMTESQTKELQDDHTENGSLNEPG